MRALFPRCTRHLVYGVCRVSPSRFGGEMGSRPPVGALTPRRGAVGDCGCAEYGSGGEDPIGLADVELLGYRHEFDIRTATVIRNPASATRPAVRRHYAASRVVSPCVIRCREASPHRAGDGRTAHGLERKERFTEPLAWRILPAGSTALLEGSCPRASCDGRCCAVRTGQVRSSSAAARVSALFAVCVVS